MRYKELIASLSSSIRLFIATRKRIYFIGFFFTFLITLNEVAKLAHNNFQIFSYGSLDFWRGINPYSGWNHLSLLGKQLDLFLYGPVFSILFTPFTLLPWWLGPFCWNFFTYSLFYWSVFTLPDEYDFVKKKLIFFYPLLTLFCTLLSLQFNPVIASLFLFSFTLLEKNKGFWAVMLILLSTFTKVYGIFQLTMLLFYPKLRNNVLSGILIAIVLLFLPVINIPPTELVDYYQSWISTVTSHSDASRFFSIYRIVCTYFKTLEPYMGFLSLAIFIMILTFTIFRLRSFKESFFCRARFLGILMSWVILFGLSSEKHTYVIAMTGYIIWYLSSRPDRLDRVLLWANFLFLGIMPIDILFPYKISSFVLAKLHLGVIVFSITWFIMVYKTFFLFYKVDDN
ncbi:MAG: DUF2029 domain-containing protein [Bacteroidales bacterium]|nr:DUF2029 domain-containing protein [Bacteroidales bacterium]